jgi:hypothetical protein
MTADNIEDQAQPLELFEWLPVLALALGRKEISGPQASVALFVALSTKGTTGERGTINIDRLELELGLSGRQVWRHFTALCKRRWFEQTALPTRGASGEKGRKARYRLTQPRLQVSHDVATSRVTDLSATTSHDHGEAGESYDTFGSNRLTLSTESCDIAEREDGTVTPADGSPTDGNPTQGSSPASTSGQAPEACAFSPGWLDVNECSRCYRPRSVHEFDALTDRDAAHVARLLARQTIAAARSQRREAR